MMSSYSDYRLISDSDGNYYVKFGDQVFFFECGYLSGMNTTIDQPTMDVTPIGYRWQEYVPCGPRQVRLSLEIVGTGGQILDTMPDFRNVDGMTVREIIKLARGKV